MFDPFNDFEINGYLRNKFKNKDPRIVKIMEYMACRQNMEHAVSYLSKRKSIKYVDFLKIHEILFSEYYPWAGQDRNTIAPNIGVSKAEIVFCQPGYIQNAIEYGLEMAKYPEVMSQKLGEIMGHFAFGHPFLDGNGRTILLIHMELCHRAGFSVRWDLANRTDYLSALTAEIISPGKGILDRYMVQFKSTASR